MMLLVSTIFVVNVISSGTGAMGRRIDPSWGGLNKLISRSSQCSTTGVTKAGVCVILWG